MPDTPEGPDGVWFRLFNEIGILSQLSGALLVAAMPPGFVVGQFSVLNHLIRVQDGRTPLDLARAFQVPKTTMTHTLSVLEAHGLVRLDPNPRDGRSKRVWITDEGRAFRDRAIAAMTPDLALLTAAMPTAALADVLPVLTRLRETMDRLRDGDHSPLVR